MALDWQTSIAAVLVFVATVYLCRRGWQTVARKSAGCGACPSCPAENAVAKPLVTIDMLRKQNSP